MLAPEILDILANTPPGAGDEIELADAINLRAQQGHVKAVLRWGGRYVCGSKFGYLEVMVDFALDHEDHGSSFAALITQCARHQAACAMRCHIFETIPSSTHIATPFASCAMCP